MDIELKKANYQLSKDKTFGKILKYNKIELKPLNPKRAYPALLKNIVGQQLSIKAADTIYLRFVNHFGDIAPAYDSLIRTHQKTLRALGLSIQKASYVKNVAKYFKGNNIPFDKMTDQEIIASLTEIKGVGNWTVHMLLMFDLNRPDIFPSGDLVIQKQMRSIYKLTSQKKAFIKEIETIATAWSPYRSFGSRYLWARENSDA